MLILFPDGNYVNVDLTLTITPPVGAGDIVFEEGGGTTDFHYTSASQNETDYLMTQIRHAQAQSTTFLRLVPYGTAGISSLDIVSGTHLGGTVVTITGVKLSPDSKVTFGGNLAVPVVFIDSTTLICTTPSHGAGAVDVVYTSGTITSTLAAAYTYT